MKRILLSTLCAAPLLAQVPISLQGKAWFQLGRIQSSTDTLGNNYNGNSFQNVTGQVSALAAISESWEGALGIGIRTVQRGDRNQKNPGISQGSSTNAARMLVGVEPYIAEARFSYTLGSTPEKPPLRLTFGYFPFQYHSDVKNLGLYLLRGTVYPGFLFSGFETDETIGIASQLGGALHANTGPFSHDLLLTSETRIRPLFDYSLAYIGKFQPSPFFRLGAGVNFYRLIPIRSDLTTPRDPDVFIEKKTGAEVLSPYDRMHFYLGDSLGVDSLGAPVYDTLRYTLKGTKVGAFFSLDPKGLFGRGSLGPEDLKLYGEAALIGVRDYRGIYDDKSQRIPVMLGFNLPLFGLLDHLSLEVEWYGARYRNDLYKLEEGFSPIPPSNQVSSTARKPEQDSTGRYLSYGGERIPYQDPFDLENMRKDDLKWSLHGAKTIKGHLRISGQIANDHFRPGGTYAADGYETAFSTLDDWYWMFKVAYLF